MSSRPNTPANSLLALDFGLRRTGVATGSALTGNASPLETVTAIAGKPDWTRLDQLIREWAPDLIVIGLPYNSDGSHSDMTGVVKEFAAQLQSRHQLPVEFIDERYTSAEAESLLREQRRQGIRNKKLKKEDVDAVAAQLIAKSWLNTARPD